MAEWTCPKCGRAFLARDARHSCVRQTPEALFAPWPDALPLYEAVRDLVSTFGPVQAEATKTQAAFRAKRRFAFLWIPQMSLKRGPPDLYLTFDLPRQVRSPRIKESVETRPRLWTHHVLLAATDDLDAEVEGWLREAYEAASGPDVGPAKRRATRR